MAQSKYICIEDQKIEIILYQNSFNFFPRKITKPLLTITNRHGELVLVTEALLRLTRSFENTKVYLNIIKLLEFNSYSIRLTR